MSLSKQAGSYLYIIRAGIITDGARPYKIGKADNVEARREQLQTGNHETLFIVAKFYIPSAALRWEDVIHQKYCAFNIHLEWYRLTLFQINEIETYLLYVSTAPLSSILLPEFTNQLPRGFGKRLIDFISTLSVPVLPAEEPSPAPDESDKLDDVSQRSSEPDDEDVNTEEKIADAVPLMSEQQIARLNEVRPTPKELAETITGLHFTTKRPEDYTNQELCMIYERIMEIKKSQYKFKQDELVCVLYGQLHGGNFSAWKGRAKTGHIENTPISRVSRIIILGFLFGVGV